MDSDSGFMDREILDPVGPFLLCCFFKIRKVGAGKIFKETTKVGRILKPKIVGYFLHVGL